MPALQPHSGLETLLVHVERGFLGQVPGRSEVLTHIVLVIYPTDILRERGLQVCNGAEQACGARRGNGRPGSKASRGYPVQFENLFVATRRTSRSFHAVCTGISLFADAIEDFIIDGCCKISRERRCERDSVAVCVNADLLSIVSGCYRVTFPQINEILIEVGASFY